MSDHINRKTIRCFVIGEESLTIQCAEILLEQEYEVLGVISDTELVLQWARSRGVQQINPQSEYYQVLKTTPFDYLFSIANLRIIPERVLELPRRAAINFHDGILPQYAGLNVTSWALLNRESRHGVTWHLMEARVDEGGILKQRTFAVAADETAFTLNTKCFEAGIASFRELVGELADGVIDPVPQDLTERQYFGLRKRPPVAATISWSQDAAHIDALCRALDFGKYDNPLGLPKCILGGEVFVVEELKVLPKSSDHVPGTITAWDHEHLVVATASQDVAISKLLTIEGVPVDMQDLAVQYGLGVGDVLPDLEEEVARRVSELHTAFCKQEAFWTRRLSELEPVQIPYAMPTKESVEQAHYQRRDTSVPRDWRLLWGDVTGTFDSAGAVLAVAFCGYLARLSGQAHFDVALGWPLLRKQLRGLDKFFASPLPWRVQIDQEAEEAASVLRRLGEQLQQEKERGTYLRDVWPRYADLRGHPERGAPRTCDVVVEIVSDTASYTLKPGMVLAFVVAEDASACSWVFNPEAITEEDVVRMQRQFEGFITQLARNGSAAFDTVSLLVGKEYDTLIRDWNATACDFPRDECIHHLFEQQVERTPDALALVHRETALTYRELNSRANQVAHYLRKAGVRSETLVGVCTDRSAEMVVGILGVLKAGGAYVPLDPDFPKDRLAYMGHDAQLSVLLSQQSLLGHLPDSAARVICLDAEWSEIAKEATVNVDSGVKAAHLSYVIYTSGSTGRPKGVMVEHRNVVNFFTGMDACIEHDPAGVWLAVTSLSFDISVLELFWTLARGFKVVLYDPEGERDSIPAQARAGTHDESVAGLIKRHGITHLQCTPSMASLFVGDAETLRALEPLQWLLVGGEALPLSLAVQLKERIGGQVVNMYGPTETTIWSSTWTVDGDGDTVPIGRPIANTTFYILDRRLQPVPIGVSGELFIGGEGVTRGYLNRSELTQERFLVDPFSERPEARMYRTGDLARYREDGVLEFLGRLDHQVKIRGYRVELGEIETLVEVCEGVRGAVAIVREDVPGDKRIVAYVIPEKGSPLQATELKEKLGVQLPSYMVPAHIIFLEVFPLTPNKKVDRKALPAPDVTDRATRVTYIVPENDLEKMIAGVWQSMLNVEKVGANDNFFDLGGHSLLMVQVHRQLQDIDIKDLSITDLFMFPTVRSLAGYIGGGDRGTKRVTKSLQRADARKEAMQRRRIRRVKGH